MAFVCNLLQDLTTFLQQNPSESIFRRSLRCLVQSGLKQACLGSPSAGKAEQATAAIVANKIRAVYQGNTRGIRQFGRHRLGVVHHNLQEQGCILAHVCLHLLQRDRMRLRAASFLGVYRISPMFCCAASLSFLKK
jgi:hypothetical protein